MPKVTQADVAARLKIHQTTVSAVLTNRPDAKITEETRRRVIETAEEMGYRPSLAARLLRKSRSRAIGIIHAGCVTHQEMLKLFEVGRRIRDRDYTPIVNDMLWFRRGAASACDMMLDTAVEAVILVRVADRFPEDDLKKLLEANIPLVAIEGLHHPQITQVVPDKRRGFYDLARHVIGLGHRRLVLIGRWPGAHHDRRHSPTTWAALDGIRDALREEGLSEDHVDTRIRDFEGAEIEDPFRLGKEAMGEILAEGGTLPDCVFCTGDAWAIGALSACVDAGVRVPEQIAVTGFNNERLSEYCHVPLTTVAQPVAELAREAVDRVFAMIEEPDEPPPPVTVALPCELVVRQSCGAHLLSVGKGRSTNGD